MASIVLFSHPTQKPFAVFVECLDLNKTNSDFDELTKDGHQVQRFIGLDLNDHGIQGFIALMRLENASGGNGIHLLLSEIFMEGQRQTN